MFIRLLKVFLSVTAILISSFYFSASAQTVALKSRVAVVSNETKTSIWVSDFPKSTSVIIMDGDHNLLSVTCTNAFGAAFVSLPANITSEVIVKTVNGEIIASNKPVIKKTQADENVAVTTPDDATKA